MLTKWAGAKTAGPALLLDATKQQQQVLLSQVQTLELEWKFQHQRYLLVGLVGLSPKLVGTATGAAAARTAAPAQEFVP